jgi:tryptophanyl-tRNA synthetase
MSEPTAEPIITPFEVKFDKKEQFDYNKIIDKFGCTKISDDLIKRFEQLTGKQAHRYLRRGIFFCHRDLENILNHYENGKKFYLYTGKGISADSLHIAHAIQFQFTQYLQEAFNVPLVIQMTDDEKFFFKDLTFEQIDKMALSNIKDVIAFGFNPKKTFIFIDSEYIGKMYRNVCRIQKALTYSTVRAAFGLVPSDNCGKVSYPAIQMAPSFPSSFPDLFKDTDMLCLIPSAIDQNPFLMLARDVASAVKSNKPSLIHSKFLPSLSANEKMSGSTDEKFTIFLTDTMGQIKKKVNTLAFSGGKDTIEEHRLLGGNCSIDIPYQYLTFFLEDDNKLKQIHDDYSSGTMTSGEIKKELIIVLQEMVGKHQEVKAAISKDILDDFMTPKPLN